MTDTILSDGTHQGRLTNDPLDPDDIIAATFWCKFLQTSADVVAHSLALLPQVCLGFIQELLRHIHQVHGVEQRQQQTFSDPPDACSTV